MNSYITLPSYQVAKLCEAWIEERNAYIMKKQEPLIQSAMKPKLFGLIKAKTREEAIAHLKDGDIFSKFNLAKLYDGYRASLVEDLYKASLLALGNGREVQLSSEAAGIIYRK